MSDSSPPATADPLRSVYTNNLPAILKQLGISLAISTYQAGRVILIRNDNGPLCTLDPAHSYQPHLPGPQEKWWHPHEHSPQPNSSARPFYAPSPLLEQLGEAKRQCGVWAVNWQTGETLAFLRFEEGVQEIFAVQIIPARFPEMWEWQDKLLMTSYVVPDAALADVTLPNKENLDE